MFARKSSRLSAVYDDTQSRLREFCASHGIKEFNNSVFKKLPKEFIDEWRKIYDDYRIEKSEIKEAFANQSDQEQVGEGRVAIMMMKMIESKKDLVVFLDLLSLLPAKSEEAFKEFMTDDELTHLKKLLEKFECGSEVAMCTSLESVFQDLAFFIKDKLGKDLEILSDTLKSKKA